MKKINVFIAVTLAILMSVGVAFATTPTWYGPGWYEFQGPANNPNNGELKWFDNHPENESQWHFVGGENPPPPTQDPDCNIARSAVHLNISGSTLLKATEGYDVLKPNGAISIGQGDFVVDGSALAKGDKSAYANITAPIEKNFIVSDGDVFTGKIDDYNVSYQWGKTTGSIYANGYAQGKDNCIFGGCDYAKIDLEGHGTVLQGGSAKTFTDAGNGNFAGAVGSQQGSAVFFGGSSSSSEGVWSKTATVSNFLDAGATVIGGTFVKSYSEPGKSIVFGVTGNYGFSNSQGSLLANVAGNGSMTTQTQAVLNSPLGGGVASTLTNSTFSYNLSNPGYVAGGGYAGGYGMSNVTQLPNGGLSAGATSTSWAGTGSNNLYKPTEQPK